MNLHSDPRTAVAIEISSHLQLRKRLLADIPEIDPETLTDTLEGLTHLHEVLAQLIRSALADEALASGLSTRLADMKERLDRFETRAKRKRELALLTMTEAQIGKIEVADFTASTRHGSAPLQIVCEEKIPAAYWKPQPPKLDKQGMVTALKSGTLIEGVAIGVPQLQLAVRTK